MKTDQCEIWLQIFEVSFIYIKKNSSVRDLITNIWGVIYMKTEDVITEQRKLDKEGGRHMLHYKMDWIYNKWPACSVPYQIDIFIPHEHRVL